MIERPGSSVRSAKGSAKPWRRAASATISATSRIMSAGRAARDVEAELRVLGSGQQVRVRMSVDAGPDAQEDRRARIAFRGDASEERDLVEVVDDDAADAFRARGEQLVLALVVAVKEDAIAWE